MLKTSATVIYKNIRILFVPLFEAFLLMIWISFWIGNFMILMSSGNIEYPTKGSQLKRVTLSKDQKRMAWGQVFMFFWIFELIQAIFNYALIVGVCTWYFTSNSDQSGNFSVTTGFWWSIRYNFGSLALGSFLLAVIWMIRITFEYIDSKLKSSDSTAAKFITNCIRYMLDCFHRFVKFLNDNAYIQIALTGENFCSSALTAFVLALKNAASFLITNGIGSIIHILGKATIVTLNVFFAFLMIRWFPQFSDVDAPIGPLAVVAIFSFFLANVFISVFSITSLTIL